MRAAADYLRRYAAAAIVSGAERLLIATVADGQYLRRSGDRIIGALPAGAGLGDLTGPEGATNGTIPLFDGVTGKLLKNSAYTPASFAAASHHHDAAYAALGHDHSGLYALTGHHHDAAYAALGHDHDAAYAAIGHDHSGIYALSGHDHDEDYAPLSHQHDAAYVAKATFNAHTLLAAVSDDTPVAVEVAEHDLLGRLAGGNIGGITLADLTEEEAPAAGDFLLGWTAEGALRKFDLGDLPGGGASLPVDDTTALVQDPGDPTRQVRLDAGAVSAATSRTIWMADRDVQFGLIATNGTTATLQPTASGSQSIAMLSGASVSGANSFAAGKNASAGGTNAVVLGGESNTAAGGYAAVLGGESNSAAQRNAIMLGGFYGSSRWPVFVGSAAGYRAAGAGCQWGVTPVRAQTTDGTATTLLPVRYTDQNPSHHLVIPASNHVLFRAFVIGRAYAGTNSGKCFAKEMLGVIARNGSNTTALVGTLTERTVIDEVAAAWAITVEADDTNEALRVKVTRTSGDESIHWVGVVETVEVG